MIRRIGKLLGRVLLAVGVLVALLLSPVAYNELACRPEGAAQPYTALLPEADHRPEARTYLTYPEWHIVHAYDDYSEVVRTGDPHQFGFAKATLGFWSSLCDLSRVSAAYGGFPWETKQMVYVIGISFSAEMLAKAAYEETLGRLFVTLRGAEPADLDTLSAGQARDYAEFLQQTPWYKWDFRADADALRAAATPALRDRERRVALGIEYRVKAAYAQAIAAAVSSVGPDALRLRLVAKDLPETLPEGVAVIKALPEGTIIETPRYRALTHILIDLAVSGTNFVEIAGNDDIMLTVIANQAEIANAQSTMARQGYGDFRHIVGLRVPDLAQRLRDYEKQGLKVEHIHDY
ncbi:MAG: hypothetical protein AAGA12_08070 [Pseudomonadota bacterium]